jgi:hypothetical protein
MDSTEPLDDSGAAGVVGPSEAIVESAKVDPDGFST